MLVDLPRDTLLEIIKGLDEPTVSRLAKTCKLFFTLTTDSKLWTQIYKQEFGQDPWEEEFMSRLYIIRKHHNSNSNFWEQLCKLTSSQCMDDDPIDELTVFHKFGKQLTIKYPQGYDGTIQLYLRKMRRCESKNGKIQILKQFADYLVENKKMLDSSKYKYRFKPVVKAKFESLVRNEPECAFLKSHLEVLFGQPKSLPSQPDSSSHHHPSGLFKRLANWFTKQD